MHTIVALSDGECLDHLRKARDTCGEEHLSCGFISGIHITRLLPPPRTFLNAFVSSSTPSLAPPREYAKDRGAPGDGDGDEAGLADPHPPLPGLPPLLGLGERLRRKNASNAVR